MKLAIARGMRGVSLQLKLWKLDKDIDSQVGAIIHLEEQLAASERKLRELKDERTNRTNQLVKELNREY